MKKKKPQQHKWIKEMTVIGFRYVSVCGKKTEWTLLSIWFAKTRGRCKKCFTTDKQNDQPPK